MQTARRPARGSSWTEWMGTMCVCWSWANVCGSSPSMADTLGTTRRPPQLACPARKPPADAPAPQLAFRGKAERAIAQPRQWETRLGAGISAQRADHLTLVEQTGQRVSLVREALPVVFGRDALHPPGSLEEVFQEEAGHVLVLGRVLRPALQQLLHGDGIACVPGLSALPQE